MKRQLISEYDQWIGEIVFNLERMFECTTSDAQGILSAHEFELCQAWSKGMTATEAAKFIDEKSKPKEVPNV